MNCTLDGGSLFTIQVMGPLFKGYFLVAALYSKYVGVGGTFVLEQSFESGHPGILITLSVGSQVQILELVAHRVDDGEACGLWW